MSEDSAKLCHARRRARQRANRKLFKGEKPKISRRSSFPNFWEWAYWRRPRDTRGLSDSEAIIVARRRIESGRE